jgi:hypothetical protein
LSGSGIVLERERIQVGVARFMADYTEEKLMFIRDFMHKLVSNSFLRLDEQPAGAADTEV